MKTPIHCRIVLLNTYTAVHTSYAQTFLKHNYKLKPKTINEFEIRAIDKAAILLLMMQLVANQMAQSTSTGFWTTFSRNITLSSTCNTHSNNGVKILITLTHRLVHCVLTQCHLLPAKIHHYTHMHTSSVGNGIDYNNNNKKTIINIFV